MTTLTEFLLARIAEDEGTAVYAQSRDDLQPEDWAGWWFGHHQHYTRHDPARVIAECEAKRAIVEDQAMRSFLDGTTLNGQGARILGHLAAIYAGHPDYSESWRP